MSSAARKNRQRLAGIRRREATRVLLARIYLRRAAETWDDEVYDDDWDGEYLGAVTCWKCGGEGSLVDCCDDLCHGQGWCMHGDNRMCSNCQGEGVL